MCKTVKETFQILNDTVYDLLLLDLTLPDGLGYEICEKVRRYSSVPIIFLTASDDEINIVKGLDIGGDDYITKPFRLTELMSRIKALIRRSNGFNIVDRHEIKIKNLNIILSEGRVYKNNRILDLSPSEYKLLCMFAQNPGIILKREIILRKLWDCNEDFIDDNTLSVYVSRLRKKIESESDNSEILETVRGVGYRWNI